MKVAESKSKTHRQLGNWIIDYIVGIALNNEKCDLDDEDRGVYQSRLDHKCKHPFILEGCRVRGEFLREIPEIGW